jgi:Ca2+-binding EF-hand superfamily protein
VNNEGFLTIDTFKEIFKNLNLGEIAPSDEDIFKEVADFDKDGVISLDDFKKILTYKPEEEGQQEEGDMEGDMEGMEGSDDEGQM